MASALTSTMGWLKGSVPCSPCRYVCLQVVQPAGSATDEWKPSGWHNMYNKTIRCKQYWKRRRHHKQQAFVEYSWYSTSIHLVNNPEKESGCYKNDTNKKVLNSITEHQQFIQLEAATISVQYNKTVVKLYILPIPAEITKLFINC